MTVDREAELSRSSIQAGAGELGLEADSDREPITEDVETRLTFEPRRVALYLAIVIAIVVGVYFLLSQLAGLSNTLSVIGDADPGWIAAACALNLLSFVSYIALFRGIVGRAEESPQIAERITWSASYQITLAGLAATRLFSAGGAGGIALTYWALRRAGMARRATACRMVAFLVVLYSIYLGALLVDGVLLQVGVFPGPTPVGMTIVPAALAGVLLVLMFLVSLIPHDFERLIADWGRGHRRAGWARRLAAGPTTIASGTRTAISLMRYPTRGVLAVGGAAGFWAANIAVLWASFHAFGHPIPKSVLVQAFFVGMAANLIPAPGGVGAVDAGMFGAFVAFNVPLSTAVAAVLVYRGIAFLLPIPPGVVAYLQLRRTVRRWGENGARFASEDYTK